MAETGNLTLIRASKSRGVGYWSDDYAQPLRRQVMVG
jgi:hypothetical protein